MRALVIGQGSIGQRHARLLQELGCAVAVVTRGASVHRCYRSVSDAVTAERLDYVVIANETARHRAALTELAAADFRGIVLVEKPLFDAVHPMPAHCFKRAAVAYNLRFHPVVLALRGEIQGRRVVSAEIYAGQWLPDWRPGTDYRTSYSARVAEGGGVLRDLSHELDLITWLFGPWSRLTALGGRRGELEIDADDTWSVLLEMASGAAVTLQINYLDRPGRRRLTVVTPDTTLSADVSAGALTRNDVSREFAVERDQTYSAQHTCLLNGTGGEPCTIDNGLDVVSTIAAIERSARERCWIERQAAA